MTVHRPEEVSSTGGVVAAGPPPHSLDDVVRTLYAERLVPTPRSWRNERRDLLAEVELARVKSGVK